jgi:hypothetical protein
MAYFFPEPFAESGGKVDGLATEDDPRIEVPVIIETEKKQRGKRKQSSGACLLNSRWVRGSF